MSDAGKRLITGMEEALRIVRGEERPAAVHHGIAVMAKVNGLRARGLKVEEQDIPGLWRVNDGPELTSNQLLGL